MPKYDDRPLYEQEAQKTNQNLPRIIPWGTEVLAHPKTALFPSPIYIWYMNEKAKRNQNLDNELDRNEISAALKGSRNRWFDRVQMNLNKYASFIEGKSSWKDIYE